MSEEKETDEENVVDVADEEQVVTEQSDYAEALDETNIQATARFYNRYNGTTYCSVRFRSGGVSNFTLRGRNDDHRIHVRRGDYYCWSINRVPSCGTRLTCYPGGNFGVGPNR